MSEREARALAKEMWRSGQAASAAKVGASWLVRWVPEERYSDRIGQYTVYLHSREEWQKEQAI